MRVESNVVLGADEKASAATTSDARANERAMRLDFGLAPSTLSMTGFVSPKRFITRKSKPVYSQKPVWT